MANKRLKILGLLNVIIHLAFYAILAWIGVFVLLLLFYVAMHLAIALFWIVIPVALGAAALFIICIPVHIANFPNHIRNLRYWLNGEGLLMKSKVKKWYNFLDV